PSTVSAPTARAASPTPELSRWPAVGRSAPTSTETAPTARQTRPPATSAHLGLRSRPASGPAGREVEHPRYVRRSLDDPEARLPTGPGAQRGSVEHAPAPVACEERRGGRRQLAADQGGVETGLRARQIARAARSRR